MSGVFQNSRPSTRSCFKLPGPIAGIGRTLTSLRLFFFTVLLNYANSFSISFTKARRPCHSVSYIFY